MSGKVEAIKADLKAGGVGIIKLAKLPRGGDRDGAEDQGQPSCRFVTPNSSQLNTTGGSSTAVTDSTSASNISL